MRNDTHALAIEVEAVLAKRLLGDDDDRFADTMVVCQIVIARALANTPGQTPDGELFGVSMVGNGLIALLSPAVRADLLADRETMQ
jgi:hypothetical protein